MKAAFGGAIAIVLLGIYVHLLRVAYLIVDCASQVGCTARTPADFNDVMAQTLTVIGGLVSALVVAELAITKPGDIPVAPRASEHNVHCEVNRSYGSNRCKSHSGVSR